MAWKREKFINGHAAIVRAKQIFQIRADANETKAKNERNEIRKHERHNKRLEEIYKAIQTRVEHLTNRAERTVSLDEIREWINIGNSYEKRLNELVKEKNNQEIEEVRSRMSNDTRYKAYKRLQASVTSLADLNIKKYDNKLKETYEIELENNEKAEEPNYINANNDRIGPTVERFFDEYALKIIEELENISDEKVLHSVKDDFGDR